IHEYNCPYLCFFQSSFGPPFGSSFGTPYGIPFPSFVCHFVYHSYTILYTIPRDPQCSFLSRDLEFALLLPCGVIVSSCIAVLDSVISCWLITQGFGESNDNIP
ncbi:hypothetical protein T310_5151, partial [Rasamsonia emersonii CBS 393.64]